MKSYSSDLNDDFLEQDSPIWRQHDEHIRKLTSWNNMRSESACHSKKRNRYFQGLTGDYLSFLIPEGSRILSLGCGSGLQLKRFKPSYALGVDIDGSNIEEPEDSDF